MDLQETTRVLVPWKWPVLECCNARSLGLSEPTGILGPQELPRAMVARRQYGRFGAWVHEGSLESWGQGSFLELW